MGTYTFTKQVPLKLFLGLFNGSGINNPSWNNKINIIGRVEFGRAEGFRAAASYYNGSPACFRGRARRGILAGGTEPENEHGGS